VALVFNAGHGVQVAGENDLFAGRRRAGARARLRYEALPLNLVLGEIAQAQKLGLAIIDACRDNPLAEQLRRTRGPIRSRLVGDGLARMENLPSDTMIAFATRLLAPTAGPQHPSDDQSHQRLMTMETFRAQR
jgi:uncharacterized caspase-like protein